MEVADRNYIIIDEAKTTYTGCGKIEGDGTS
jgi:hypothetical protein